MSQIDKITFLFTIYLLLAFYFFLYLDLNVIYLYKYKIFKNMTLKKNKITRANIKLSINLGFVYQDNIIEIIYCFCKIIFKIFKQIIYFQEYVWIFFNFCKSIFINKVLSYLSEYFLWLPFLLPIIFFLFFLYDLFGTRIIRLIYHNLNLIFLLLNFFSIKYITILLIKFNPYYTVKNNYLNISTTGDNGNTNNSDNQTIFTWKNFAIGAVVIMTISGTVVGIYYYGPDLVEISRQAVIKYIASQPRYRLTAHSNATMSADEASVIVAVIGNWAYQMYMWEPSMQELICGEYLVKWELDQTGKIFWNIIKDGGEYFITGSKESGFDIVSPFNLNFGPNKSYEFFYKELSEGVNFTINTTKSACNSIIRTVTTTMGDVEKATNIEIYRLKPNYYILKVLGFRIKVRTDSSIILEI